MAKTLILTNLKAGVSEELIRNFLFNQGEIRSIKLTPPQDSQQGHAYVTMSLDKDAADSLRKLNRRKILGQEVLISRV